MTDVEFTILDELYFVISYQELSERLTLSSDQIIHHLLDFHKRGWLRVFASPVDTRDLEIITAQVLCNSYLLASKMGLKAHNS